MEPGEKLFLIRLIFVKGFCYLEDRLTASGGTEAVVTARTRIAWIKFRECGELCLWEKVFIKNERKDLSELCKISNAVWEQGMVSKEE